MRSRAILKGRVSPLFFSVAVLGQVTLFQRPDIATGLRIPLNVYIGILNSLFILRKTTCLRLFPILRKVSMWVVIDDKRSVSYPYLFCVGSLRRLEV